MTNSQMVPGVFAHELERMRLESSGPRSGASSGEPVEAEIELYNDGHVEVGVWECTPGEFPSVKEGITEQMLFLSGDATIWGEDGSTYEVAPGVLLVTPDGWRGGWQIRQTVRKVYTIWQTR
jgi:uncharacterized protein